MRHFIFLKTRLEEEEIISIAKEYKAIAIRPQLAALKGFIEFCYDVAKADFRNKCNIAERFEIQLLCRIACTPNIKKAISFCKPSSNEIAIISENKLPLEVLGKIGKPISPPKFDLREISNAYSLSGLALKNHSLEELLREKCLISFLETN